MRGMESIAVVWTLCVESMPRRFPCRAVGWPRCLKSMQRSCNPSAAATIPRMDVGRTGCCCAHSCCAYMDVSVLKDRSSRQAPQGCKQTSGSAPSSRTLLWNAILSMSRPTSICCLHASPAVASLCRAMSPLITIRPDVGEMWCRSHAPPAMPTIKLSGSTSATRCRALLLLSEVPVVTAQPSDLENLDNTRDRTSGPDSGSNGHTGCWTTSVRHRLRAFYC